MDNEYHSATLFVKDIDASRRFRSEVPDLTMDLDFGRNMYYSRGFTSWEIQSNNVIPSISGTDRITDKIVSCFGPYFETETLREYFRNLPGYNLPFLNEIH
jgi:hypothetical protein